MYNLTDLAWLAGFFDGEGTMNLSFRKHSTSWQIRVRITNTHKLSITHIQEILGFGYITEYASKNGYRPYWVWACEAISAEKFLAVILPYLVTKQEQAKVALEASQLRRSAPRIPKGKGNGRGRSRISPETHQTLFALSNQIKALNSHTPLVN